MEMDTQMNPPKPSIGSKFDDRWPPAVTTKGFVAVPNCLLICQDILKITQAELGVLLHLLSYKYTNRNPFPSVMTIAKNSGQSHQIVRAKIVSLEKKGLLKRHLPPAQTTNYDFFPLL